MTNAKIRKFEEAEIVLEGCGCVHLAETTNGYNIDISQNFSKSIRIGIPFRDGKGTYYTYWENIVKAMQDTMTTKE